MCAEPYTAAFRSMSLHPGDPSRDDIAEDALHIATIDEIAGIVDAILCDTNIFGRVENADLQIDAETVREYMPIVLRFLADRLDAERAKRLAKVALPVFEAWKLPEIRR